MKKRVIRGIKSAVIGITVSGVYFASNFFVNIVPTSEIWSESSGEHLPERDFYAVAFPRGDSVMLHDNKGNSCGILERAVLISLEEWQADSPIGVYTSATETCFAARADLTLDPISESAAEVWPFNAGEFYFYTFDPETDAIRSFEHVLKGTGQHVATVFFSDGDRFMSEYRSEGDVITPLRVRRYNSKAEAFEIFLTSVMATMMGMIAVAVYWAILVVRWWWFRPRPPEAAA